MFELLSVIALVTGVATTDLSTAPAAPQPEAQAQVAAPAIAE